MSERKKFLWEVLTNTETYIFKDLETQIQKHNTSYGKTREQRRNMQ